MDYHPFKARLNRFLMRHVGGDQRPTFLDIDETYPALARVTRAYPAIREECERILRRREVLPKYHEIDPGEKGISAEGDLDRHWYVFMLYILGYKPLVNRAACAATCEVLDGIPNLVQAFLSILDPGKRVPRHEGPYLGYLRYHLALRVPEDNPPTLIVNSQKYVWKAGEAVLFDDSWPHEVVNESRDLRVVLIVDVLRPMSLLPSLVNRLVMRCLVRPTYGRSVARRAARSAFLSIG
jgi:aspartate beta-hydroxylase